jgi:hypothetical protein
MPSTPRCRSVVPFLLGWALSVGLLACNDARIKSDTPGGGAGHDQAVPGTVPAAPGAGGVSLPDAVAPASRDAGASGSGDGGACQPASCTPLGGQYCGLIGDGCGGRLDCGSACPMAQTCGGGGTKNLCGSPPDPTCQPIECVQRGGRLCGRVGDGCGGAKDCGTCPGGEACGGTIANVCGQGGGAVPVATCPAGQATLVTGTVFAPTPMKFGAADPLYNALVYVPTQPVQAFAPGVACDLCGAAVSGAPVVSTLSGADGTFILKDVPAGDNVPLVIQIGRWRRQITIPKVVACTSTALPGDLTRLPRNHSEGDIPQMAIATGTWDPMECLLRKVGIDDSEFTPPSGPGRVHMYQFGGYGMAQPIPSGNELVKDLPTLSKYDLVMFPCDDLDAKTPTQMSNVQDYTGRGGRVFLTDWGHIWLHDGDAGPWHSTVDWLPKDILQGPDFDTAVDQTFPKGAAFAQWLGVVGASPQPGRLHIHDPYQGDSYFLQVRPPTQRWLFTDKAKDATVQHFTFNTPVGLPADKQCGRVVYSNFHVAVETDDGSLVDPLSGLYHFPQQCSNQPMTPQEKALEFMLFDASACILPDTEKPHVFVPPPPAPPPPPPVIE